MSWFLGDRILLRRLVNRQQRLMASRIVEHVITNKNLYVIRPIGKVSIEYVLALLNSKLLSRLYLAQVTQATKDDFPQVTIINMLELPVPDPNFDDANTTQKCQEIVALVTRMLILKQKIAATVSAEDRERLDLEIQMVDHSLDKAIYGLYGMTDDEIDMVERSY